MDFRLQISDPDPAVLPLFQRILPELGTPFFFYSPSKTETDRSRLVTLYRIVIPVTRCFFRFFDTLI